MGATNPTSMPGDRTGHQKQEPLDAQIARARLRQGKILDRLEGKTWRPFTARQREVLDQYRSGWLRNEANKLTLISGHGRLKKEDDSFVDIGGSTGGFVRTVLDDWEPPDLADSEGDRSLICKLGKRLKRRRSSACRKCCATKTSNAS